jgi:chemotaxis protein CheD
MFDRKVVVGIGGLAVSKHDSTILSTYSLGSCLGVTIYDPVVRAGGMLHAMLPESALNQAKAEAQPGLFVDSGLSALFRAAYELRAEKHRVKICVAGCAHFLDPSGIFNIGQRNLEAFHEIMGQHGLGVTAEDVGGVGQPDDEPAHGDG